MVYGSSSQFCGWGCGPSDCAWIIVRDDDTLFMSETGYKRWFYLQKQDAWNFRDFFGRSFYSFHFSFIFILYIRQEVAMVPEKRVISTVIGLKYIQKDGQKGVTCEWYVGTGRSHFAGIPMFRPSRLVKSKAEQWPGRELMHKCFPFLSCICILVNSSVHLFPVSWILNHMLTKSWFYCKAWLWEIQNWWSEKYLLLLKPPTDFGWQKYNLRICRKFPKSDCVSNNIIK